MGIAAWALAVSIGSAVISIGTVGVTVWLARRRESYEERLKRERLALDSHTRLLSSVRELGTSTMGSPEKVEKLNAFILAMRTEILTPYSLLFADNEAGEVIKTVGLMARRDRDVLSQPPDTDDSFNLSPHVHIADAIERFIGIVDKRSKQHFGHLAPKVESAD